MDSALVDHGIRQLWETDRGQALERLMDAYGDKVLHLAYFYLRDRHLAEDLAQEVFIKVYRNLETFRGESSISTWIYRITVNLCRDRLRSRSWRSQTLESDLSSYQSHAPDAEARMVEEDGRRAVLEAVMSLPAHYREVVALYYYQEQPVGTIARMLGETPGTIKSRLYRARVMLKARLPREEAER